MNHYVEIYETNTDRVERRFGPMSERKADRLARGAGINLTHEQFAVRVIEGETV